MSCNPPSIDVVYLSPRNKRCVLVPSGRSRPWLEFRYLDETTLAGGGFFLTHENFRIIREAPRQSTTHTTGRRVSH